MTQMRDARGRFCKATVTTNNTTNLNDVKENNTMMNRKMNAREQRMEALRNNGVNVDNFFNLNLQIPFGHEVRILVDGKEMIVPTTVGQTSAPNTCGLVNSIVNFTDASEFAGTSYAEQISNILGNDAIAQNIIENGYVKNSKLFRRYITAHTFKMLNYVSYKDKNRKGWEACMKDCYDYNYQFKMLLEEIRVLSILQKEDQEAFEERTHFFNGDVVVATLMDYRRRLEKYINKQLRENPRKYKGQAYVKLARYGNVLVKDLYEKVYIPIQERINVIDSLVRGKCEYTLIEKEFKNFMSKYYNKLPAATTKCSIWKDTFKGIGGFESLRNLIRFHNVVLEDCRDKYDSEKRLYELLNGEYKNEVWRFHQLLVDTIELNNFDLKQSIANGHAAPNTRSERAFCRYMI